MLIIRYVDRDSNNRPLPDCDTTLGAFCSRGTLSDSIPIAFLDGLAKATGWDIEILGYQPA